MSDRSDLTVVNASFEGQTVGMHCKDGRIVALGHEVEADGGRHLDAGGRRLMPPLVNGHTHAAMTLFRGYGGDLPLMRWLREKVWPVEARLDPEDVYWGARLACIEMIRTGTARFWDSYWHPSATAQAVVDAGLRATLATPLIDLGDASIDLQGSALQSLEDLSGLDPRVAPALAPHAIYTVCRESLRWVAQLAEERHLPIHIHVSETEEEVRDCVASYGMKPIEYLDRLGLLGERTLLAHGVWLDEKEFALTAERNCTVVTNPVANMKLSAGAAFPYRVARSAGVSIGLGTDGAGSNDSLDLFADLKMFALMQRHSSGDPSIVSADEAWKIAIGASAPLLTDWEPAGLRVGGPADFLLLQKASYELELGDLTSNLVYAASGSIVDTMVVAGRVLMANGKVEGAEEVVSRAAECAKRLGISSPVPVA